MALSHIESHSLLQAFKCDFCACDAMFVRYLLSSLVHLFVYHKPALYQNGYT